MSQFLLKKKNEFEILTQSKEELKILKLLKKNNGFLKIKNKVQIYDRYCLSLVYTPFVGECCTQIQKNESLLEELTNKQNTIFILSDRTFEKKHSEKKVLEVAFPILECQCVMHNQFSFLDAYPFFIDTRNEKDIDIIVESIISLQFSCQAIQFMQMDQKILHYLNQTSKSVHINITISTLKDQLFFEQQITDNFEIQFIPGQLMSLIIKAAMDTFYKGFIKIDILEFVALKTLQEKKHINNLPQLQCFIYAVTVDYIQKNYQDQVNTISLVKNFNQLLVNGKQTFHHNWPKNELISKVNKETLSILLHQTYRGAIKIKSNIKLSFENFIKYQQFVISSELQNQLYENPKLIRHISFFSNWACIISNGTAVLGFGDMGPKCALPVMEGKSALFNQLAGVNVLPIVLEEKNPEQIVKIIQTLKHVFNAICLEDIHSPDCFYIEQMLNKILDIPVFHDDQHGTAIVVTAAVINSVKLVQKEFKKLKVVINGGGAAGISIAQMMLNIGVINVIILDTHGSIYKGRTDNMNSYKTAISAVTNPNHEKGKLEHCIKNADIFIGVSAGNAFSPSLISLMSPKPIIMALANPNPEILPPEALSHGAYIVCTGRSDFPNQVNNSLVFPGLFRAVIDTKSKSINVEMKLAAAYALAEYVQDLDRGNVIPSSLDTQVHKRVVCEVAKAAILTGQAQIQEDIEVFESNFEKFIFDRQVYAKF